MDELRKNHIIQLETINKEKFDGIIFDYTFDRVMVLIAYDSLANAKNIKELDKFLVTVNTHLGIKKMFSSVISTLDNNNCIVIENNDTIPVVQKRQFVRVLSNFDFKITKEDESIVNCSCINISAGGIAFIAHDLSFNLEEDVQIELPENLFEKQILTKAKIIKIFKSHYVAQFTSLNTHEEDKIVKHVYKLVSRK